jgi:hypothetical protein
MAVRRKPELDAALPGVVVQGSWLDGARRRGKRFVQAVVFVLSSATGLL